MLTGFDMLSDTKWYHQIWIIPLFIIALSIVAVYRWVRGR